MVKSTEMVSTTLWLLKGIKRIRDKRRKWAATDIKKYFGQCIL